MINHTRFLGSSEVVLVDVVQCCTVSLHQIGCCSLLQQLHSWILHHPDGACRNEAVNHASTKAKVKFTAKPEAGAREHGNIFLSLPPQQ